MSARVHFYGFNNITGSYRTYGSMIEQFAADAMPIGWEWGDDAVYDRDYIAQQDRYSIEEWFNADEDCAEVLCRDGEPIGVLDQLISRDDLLVDYSNPERVTRHAAE